MAPQLRNLDPGGDLEAERVLDAAFHRAQCESRVLRELARAHPSFDPELALVAEEEGRAIGCALLLPRTLFVRGAEVPAVVLGPCGVDPAARGRGVGGLLVRAGLERAARRGALAAVALGVPEFFETQGFAPAFDLGGLHVPAEVLPAGAEAGAWRGLAGEDLAGLIELHAASYREVSGAERRTGDALDWESMGPRAHTLVHPGADGPLAYLRFRVREELEVLECGAASPAGVAAVLAMLARLAREHARLALFARLPEPHPVARALYHRGAPLERSNLGGAGLLRVLDWPAFLMALAPAWAPLLVGLEPAAWSLGLDEDALSWRLELGSAGPRVALGRVAGAHLALPASLAPALFTGQRGLEELLFEPRIRAESDLGAAHRARLLLGFAPRAATWGYAPVFELADD